MSKGTHHQVMILEAFRSWFHWIWNSNEFPRFCKADKYEEMAQYLVGYRNYH